MRIVHVLGKLLMSVGFGILLFVAWELWATGIYTSGQQNQLEREFDQLPVVFPPAKGPPSGFARRLGPGDPVFRIRIPAINVRRVVVEGVGIEELRKGPGHYPQCRSGFVKPLCTGFREVFPGERGRVIVSGHRTTYGAPFWSLDKLNKGDEIITQTKWGSFTYEVVRKRVVLPTDATIITRSNKHEIVLTTCNPKFSAAQRLIVYGRMVRAA